MSEWISVKDRLPELDQPVWLRMEGDTMIIGERSSDSEGWLWSACYGFYFNMAGEWDAVESDASDEHEPTHWMPLPLPPKEGK